MTSDQYMQWIKWMRDNEKSLIPLTNSQHRFVEFLLENDNITKQVGSFIHLFTDVRDFIRENPELFSHELK